MDFNSLKIRRRPFNLQDELIYISEPESSDEKNRMVDTSKRAYALTIKENCCPTFDDWRVFDVNCLVEIGNSCFQSGGQQEGYSTDLQLLLLDWNQIYFDSKKTTLQYVRYHQLLFNDTDTHNMIFNVAKAIGSGDNQNAEHHWKKKYKSVVTQIEEVGDSIFQEQKGDEYDWRSTFSSDIKNMPLEDIFTSEKVTLSKNFESFFGFVFIMKKHFNEEGFKLPTQKMGLKKEMDIIDYVMKYVPKLRYKCVELSNLMCIELK
jgi:hypothetical protein